MVKVKYIHKNIIRQQDVTITSILRYSGVVFMKTPVTSKTPLTYRIVEFLRYLCKFHKCLFSFFHYFIVMNDPHEKLKWSNDT